jgi:hypothetical protein
VESCEGQNRPFEGPYKSLFTAGKFELGKGKIAVFSGPPENNTGYEEQFIFSHYSTSHLDDSILLYPLLGAAVDVSYVGFCGGHSGAGVGFFRVLRFPLPIFIPPIVPKIIFIHHRGLYNRPKWPQYLGA